MQVLVTVASKHGATAEIGDAIRDRLAASGLDTVRLDPQDVDDLAGVDAVVLGSAVYAGHWLRPATEFVDRFGTALRDLPVWLFSSGPVGEPAVPHKDAVVLDEALEATGATAHALFTGRVDRSLLGFGERALVRALRVPEGDYRDWEAVAGWADEIVDVLSAESTLRDEATPS